jgi:ribosomal protein S3
MSKKSFACLYINNNKSWTSSWYSSKQIYSNLIQEDLILYIFVRSLLLKSVFKEINGINLYKINKKNLLNLLFNELSLTRKINLHFLTILKHLKFFLKKNIYISTTFFSKKKSNMNAFNLGITLAKLIEKRVRFKSKLIKTMLKKVKRFKKGVYIQCIGRINNVDIARIERIYFGSVSLLTINLNIDYSMIIANTVKGLQSIKVWICK